MAKGVFTIEFCDLADLEAQLRAALGCGCKGHPELAKVGPEPIKMTSEPAGDEYRAKVQVQESLPPAILEPEKPIEEKPQPQQEPEKPAEEKKPEPAPAQQGEETLTLENMAQASHEELLAFCGRHSEVGIDPSKCAAPFFRSMIEHRIRAYLSPAT